LACHKASGQDVDTLKEPNRSENQQQDTNDDKRNPHGYDLDCIRIERASVDTGLNTSSGSTTSDSLVQWGLSLNEERDSNGV
jgi:hypothetical protein